MNEDDVTCAATCELNACTADHSASYQYDAYFKDRLDYEGLLRTYRVSGEGRPVEVVKSRFMKLESAPIGYILDSFQENTCKVTNTKNYMMTMLYNTPLTIDHYYRAKWNNLKNSYKSS